MLCELNIKDFAIIEEQSIQFGQGLNVISGETGSGKSIILQALELLLGAKSKAKYIRKGSEGWTLEAFFNLEHIDPQLFAELPDIAQHKELVISRSTNSAGRGKVYINGNLGTVSLLEDISKKLINICSQSQHLRLLDPKYHLSLIDGFAENAKVLKDYSQAYQSWKQKELALKDLEERLEKSLVRKSELEFLAQELKDANIYPGKRKELESEISKLANAENIIQSVNRISGLLSSEHGVSDLIGQVALELTDLQERDNSVEKIASLVSSAQAELSEFEGELSAYGSSVEIDEDKLEELRDSLASLAALERKYQKDDAALVSLFEEVQEELLSIEDVEGKHKLEQELEEQQVVLKKVAAKLSERRKKAAKRLSKRVGEELEELNMVDAVLSVNFEKIEFSASGSDRVEIFIATNKGENARPLREIASGGELSRITLVLKKVLKERSGVNVLIFDEVDAGISGGVARAVGKKLLALSDNSQVICITHLAQVASLATHHFLVGKLVGTRTKSHIRELNSEEKIDEIARMLAGYTITEASRESARELLSSNV